MGYQESFLFCEDRDTMNKLCKALNTVKPELDDYVTVFAVGKMKKRVGLLDCFTRRCHYYLNKDLYFVWWGGERHPYQSGCYEELLELGAEWPYTGRWYCIFCEYIANMKAILRGIDTSTGGVLQENDRIRIFGIPRNEDIREEYIQIIDTPAAPEDSAGRKEST